MVERRTPELKGLKPHGRRVVSLRMTLEAPQGTGKYPGIGDSVQTCRQVI